VGSSITNGWEPLCQILDFNQASLGSRLGYRVFGQVYVLGYVIGYLDKFSF